MYSTISQSKVTCLKIKGQAYIVMSINLGRSCVKYQKFVTISIQCPIFWHFTFKYKQILSGPIVHTILQYLGTSYLTYGDILGRWCHVSNIGHCDLYFNLWPTLKKTKLSGQNLLYHKPWFFLIQTNGLDALHGHI